ncbi:protein FAM3C isoform X1 [Stigmatopora argus]
MRHRIAPYTAVIVVLVVTWAISHDSIRIQQTARDLMGMKGLQQVLLRILPKNPYFNKYNNIAATILPSLKCDLSRRCPHDHFAMHVRSGAANVVGPKICFDGKIIMSHILNNVGPGLNIVIVNSETGAVDRCAYLNMINGVSEDILAYLKEIKSGEIVIVASFDEMTTKMTSEMRDIFVGMGSTLIQSVSYRDNWVFAGRGGIGMRSTFEKRAANNETSNIYEGWPKVVEVGGCFPRST